MTLENNAPTYSPKINNLMDAVYINNELTDTISPSIAILEITSIVGEMLEGNVAYVSKHGMNDMAKESRERLKKLLNVTELFNTISSQNSTLKTFNNQLLREVQALRSYKKEVERQELLSKSV